MRIQNNIMAMNTHRQLGVNNTNQAKSTEKLSSGFRINRAADDAAGLAISEKMRAQIRGLNMASKNAQDGISLVQAAESALQTAHDLIQRGRELSVQAASDVNQTEDRDAIQKEINQILSELDRIAYTTEFNKKTVLNGTLERGFKAAYVTAGGNVSGLSWNQATDAPTVAQIINVTEAAAKYSETWSFDAQAFKQFDDTLDITVTVGDMLEWNDSAGRWGSAVQGTTVTLSAGGYSSLEGMLGELAKMVKENLGSGYNVVANGTSLTIEAKHYGMDSGAVTTVAGIGAASTSQTVGATITVEVNDSPITGDSAAYLGNGYFKSGDLTFRIDDMGIKSNAFIGVQEGSPLTIQVGANTGSSQAIAISIGSITSTSLNVSNVSVKDHQSSQAAVDAFESALQRVSDQRSTLGAVQNRLEFTVANLDNVAENLQAAESRIRDVDIAKEMMNFVKSQILQQAATAMLAQANQVPQTVLQLLR